MDLSVNKIIKSNNKINFKGLKSGYLKDNTPVYRFYAPPFYSKKEKVMLEFVFLQKDKNTNQYIVPRDGHFTFKFNGDEPIEIYQKNLKDATDAFGYRYVITNTEDNSKRYITDDTTSIDGFNIIEQGDNYGITPKTGPMYHAFIDANTVLEFNKKLNKYTQKSKNTEFVRNHFNKLGGSLEGLTYLLEETHELDPYRYIMTNPYFGLDKLSSHGYWPNNQYQCRDIDAFKDLIFKMYKKGKGYVADGAFTSQGLQSPMVQHVMKWGEESPFYNMLKIDSKLNLGILPDRSFDDEIGQLDFIAAKLINNPLTSEYDRTKPTYMQLFDTRLASEELQNSNELIESYDTNPEDHYDITTHQDSVIPYYFEIDKNDFKKLEYFKNGNRTILLDDIDYLDDFLTFKNYKITTKANASGANFWDGNRDIIKMNLSNPSGDFANKKGFFDARNYLLNVASFWTEAIQSDLILKTALMNEAERKQTAQANGISNEKYEALKSSLSSLKYPVLEQNKTIYDYVEEFPLQSIETSPDLSAIFSEPEFNGELLKKNTLDVIADMVKSTLQAVTPNEFKNNKEYKTYLTKLYAPMIIKNIYVSALCPKAVDEKGNINRDVLKDISIYSLGANNAYDVNAERNIVINKIKNGLNFVDLASTRDKIEKDIKGKGLALDDFKLAEAIVLQGRAGLNWRFDAAKDIGDLDKVDKNGGYGTSSFDYIWYGDKVIPGVVDFWSDFIHNIKKYNPAAYNIAEVTCIGDFTSDNAAKVEADFLNKTGATTSSNYSYYFNNLSEFVGVNPEEAKKTPEDWAGNIQKLRGKIEEFLQTAQPNTAILNHMFTDNHDKPHMLHTLPLNMPLFFNGNDELCTDDEKQIITKLIENKNLGDVCPQAVAVGLIMYKQIENSNYDNSVKDKLKQSLINLVNGYKGDSKKYNYRRALAFGTLPYEITIRDMFKGAGIEDEEKILDFHFNMLEKSIKREVILWDMMNAIVGVPTLYNGEEFFQTGYETPGKNKYVGNRNEVLHELKNDKRYKKYYDKIQKITDLYKEAGMSAIRDGFSAILDDQCNNGINILPIFKYDENGSKVLTLVTNNGIKGDYAFKTDINTKTVEVDEINLTKNGSASVLQDEIKFRRKIYKNGKYIDDGKTYVINKGKLKAENGGRIALGDAVEYFYAVSEPKAENKEDKKTEKN